MEIKAKSEKKFQIVKKVEFLDNFLSSISKGGIGGGRETYK